MSSHILQRVVESTTKPTMRKKQNFFERAFNYFHNLLQDDTTMLMYEYEKHFTEPPPDAFEKLKKPPKCGKGKKKESYICERTVWEVIGSGYVD